MTATPENTSGATPAEWDHFAALCGEDLLPVVSNTKCQISPKSNLKELGKVPSMIYPTGAGGIKDWPQHHTTPDEINQWKKEKDYGICIITRLKRAFDVDISDPARSREVRDVIEAIVGPLPARTRSNSGKLLLAFELAGELPKRVIRGEAGIIELLGEKQQFISAGQHSLGEVRYEWLGGLPRRVPVLTLEEVNLVWAELARRYAIEPPVTEKASVRRNVMHAAIVNDPIAQYIINKTDRVREINNETGEILIRCPNSAEHTGDSGDTETVYYPPHTGGFSHGGFKCMHAHCQHITMPMFKSMIGYTDDEVLAAFDFIGEGRQARVQAEVVPPDEYGFHWHNVRQFMQRPQPDWHIKHVLPKAELILIYGASGSGKSFFALDLAFAIDQGAMWRGHAVTKGRVAYVVAEGSGSFRNRVNAYIKQHQLDPASIELILLPAAPNMMERATAVNLSKSIVARGEFALVLIDTMAQVTAGANENSGEDMGLALLHCRGVHRYTKATVALIHHAGKDASKGARGWSGMHAAADCVIEVIRDNDRRCATVVKQKDGNDGANYGFVLDTVVLAHDDDGEAITSCVLRYTDEGRPVRRAKPIGTNMKLVKKVFGEMNLNKEEGVPCDNLICAAVKQMKPHDKGKVDRRREMIKKAIDSVTAEGHWSNVSGVIKQII